jgi:hypothetical protein
MLGVVGDYPIKCLIQDVFQEEAKQENFQVEPLTPVPAIKLTFPVGLVTARIYGGVHRSILFS